ncbi:MAG: hypothetical protein R3B09_23780 [Nannocystaceae bacterium]
MAIERPAADYPVRPRRIDLPPGGSISLASPIRLRCQPEGPPDPDPLVWTVRHPREGLILRAHLAMQRVAPARGSEVDAREASSRLAELLQAPATVESWTALCRCVVAWPREALGEVPIARIEAALAPWPDALREIYGDWSRFGRGGEAGPLGRLARVVTISHRSDGSAELGRVAASPDLDRVVRLTIVRSDITAGAFAALGRSTTLRSLAELSMTRLTLTDDDVRALAGAPLWRRLTTFRARSCGLDDRRVRALIEPSEIAGLSILDLSGNRISPRCADWLKTRGSRGAGLLL